MPAHRTTPAAVLPLAAWAVLMLTVSSIPGDRLPQPGFIGWDKVAHTGEYAVFAVLLWRYLGLRMSGWRQIATTLAIGAVFGVVDEAHQIPIPNRTCSGYDLLADVAGVAAGAWLAVKIPTTKTRRTRRATKEENGRGRESTTSVNA